MKGFINPNIYYPFHNGGTTVSGMHPAGQVTLANMAISKMTSDNVCNLGVIKQSVTINGNNRYIKLQEQIL